jgi:ubiquinone/menaquinone biosynthesis C-methylase UbiE
MTPAPERASDSSSSRHYSYAHYADQMVAEGFDALRFGGAIGRHLFETQAALLRNALSPLAGRRIVDVGTGTGRAAIGLAVGGAEVLGLDASGEMLGVGVRRAQDAGARVRFARADAHLLPMADRSVDAALSLRVLMHAIDWRACLAELCRVSRWRVIVDFPAALSFAALESAARRAAKTFGRPVEAYRVIAERDMADALRTHGFRIVQVHREFVLPIAIHKKINRAGATLAIERVLSGTGLLRLLGSPVTVVAER